jgi:hypothetical protein
MTKFIEHSRLLSVIRDMPICCTPAVWCTPSARVASARNQHPGVIMRRKPAVFGARAQSQAFGCREELADCRLSTNLF